MPEAIVLTASRRLLRNLRDVMAAPGTAQQRLDNVVKLIASNLVAEVCSIYGLRAGEVLELFATEGLNPDAVHKTRLRVGEGLVGDIAAHARPLALSDAQTHPLFAYRPETGEEIYHSLMGVPILRGGRVIGVVVVQNRTRRHYTDEEVETLQTIAMVLAELVAGSGMVSSDELRPTEGLGLLPIRLDGLCFNTGIAMGLAVMHQPRIAVNRLVAEDPASELKRLREAVKGMHSALDDLLAADDLAHSGEHRDVLEAYRMIAEDRGWLRRIREAIRSGLTAEAAVQRVQEDMRARMSQVTDPYIRERLQDFEDVTNRVLQHLTGYQDTAARQELPDDVVLIARNMGPAELLDYDRRRLRALLLEEGAAHAHVAIVARALEIPVLGRVRSLLERVEPGDLVIVDGDHAQAFIRPGEDVQQIFSQSVETRKRRQLAYARLRDLPAVTRDGVSVSLQLNAGLLMDVENLKESGADGIGLYRTEIPFMVRPQFPNVAEQTEFYRKALELAGDRAVVFRTLDVGGDKLLPYFPKSEDENPAMGWRAIRIALDRPAILRQQVRALLRAHGERPLHVMFPMIAEVAEFDAARSIVDVEVELARRQRRPVPSAVRVGAMLEVPALAWQMPALLRRAAFVSVGSNDLFQFLFACDRGNPRIADRYDALSPAVLAFMRSIVSQCTAANVPITVCGEMAGRPLEAMALVGLGFRSLSMTSNAIGPVKEMIRSLDLGDLRDYLGMFETAGDHSLRGKLSTYARDHGVVI